MNHNVQQRDTMWYVHKSVRPSLFFTVYSQEAAPGTANALLGVTTVESEARTMLAIHEMIQDWRAAKSTFVQAGVDLAKYGSSWVS